ncbi:MAG: spermidine/putrescine ABC transporter substrate-binding protein, partial [Candidatus Cloacimonetes bacterium]|nr:spermidine/putrescine ABC transporter substrate-binding protein [Candidatus Cloacimonadota bacterium]
MKKTSTIITIIIMLFCILSCQSKPKQILYIFNWTDYIAPELVKKFERQYHCRIKYDTYNSNESMLSKMTTTNVAYDIIVPSGDHLSILIEKDLVDKIDKSQLSNYHNLKPLILQKMHEDDNSDNYGVPYFWGTGGIVFNTQYISEKEMQGISWDIFGDEKFAGKGVITLLEDIREVVGVALITNGFDPNDTSDEAIKIARETLLKWSPNIAQFDSDSFKNEVQDGTIWL